MVIRNFLGHLLFWIVIMLTYAISEWGYSNNFKKAILFEFLFLPVRILAVYANWLVLIPRLLYKNQIVKYLLSLAFFLLCLAILQRYFSLCWGYSILFPNWDIESLELFELPKIVQALVIITSPVAFSTGIKLFMGWYKQRNQAKHLAIEKREAELKYLKSQINPHFLFNTLNNLYGLSIEKSDRLPSLILKLSDFLSYSLYESNVKMTSVGREMRLIRDFVELEMYRYENRVKVHWIIEGDLEETITPPLLFMPLVENAFKHGVKEETSQAVIRIKLWKENTHLNFEVVNSIPNLCLEKPPQGIGLNNLKRRLQIGYPQKHSLKTQVIENHFYASLKLNIDE